ncbi:MAG: hypothetical protein LWW95_03530 [Candidatus Desulfofervidus auxilii]|nr:hypothetical protein [Candidatus Desulfofervidus auxilii]
MYEQKKSYLIVFLLIICLFPTYLLAKVTGVCSNCHTMHSSQSPWPSYWEKGGPREYLLVNDCVGCHSSNDSQTIKEIGAGSGKSSVPIVYNTQEPTNPLAGGNFYWVANGCDGCGHNVTAIPGVSKDPNFTQTPGFVSGKTCSSCHGSGNMELTKCIFCHNPKHHGDDSGPVVGDDEEVKYRFLSLDSFHPYTFQQGSYNFYGVAGIEDDDWEYDVSSSDHNEYCGAASSGDYSGKSHSISRFCAACHWGFYGENTEHWKRHPSDIALPNSGEYANYTTYNPLAPIARLESTLTSMTGASSTVTPGQDQVSCLSCHRPHASPYPDILRWDYQGWPGSGTNGCNVCHTTKD